MGNSKAYPEAWQIFVDCVRKFPQNKEEQRYGIPNPLDFSDYLWSFHQGVLFWKFKTAYYSVHKKNKSEIQKFVDFLVWLEKLEGKKG